MLNIDSRSSMPIYEQVKIQIKELIMKGALRKGDKLPSVREMASNLSINPNTISKSYSELEKEGIIETLRGKGTFVSSDIIKKSDDKMSTLIKNELKKLIVEASYNGIKKSDFMKITENIFKELGVNEDDKCK